MTAFKADYLTQYAQMIDSQVITRHITGVIDGLSGRTFFVYPPLPLDSNAVLFEWTRFMSASRTPRNCWRIMLARGRHATQQQRVGLESAAGNSSAGRSTDQVPVSQCSLPLTIVESSRLPRGHPAGMYFPNEGVDSSGSARLDMPPPLRQYASNEPTTRCLLS